jgi:hypothetical protein
VRRGGVVGEDFHASRGTRTGEVCSNASRRPDPNRQHFEACSSACLYDDRFLTDMHIQFGCIRWPRGGGQADKLKWRHRLQTSPCLAGVLLCFRVNRIQIESYASRVIFTPEKNFFCM